MESEDTEISTLHSQIFNLYTHEQILLQFDKLEFDIRSALPSDTHWWKDHHLGP